MTLAKLICILNIFILANGQQTDLLLQEQRTFPVRCTVTGCYFNCGGGYLTQISGYIQNYIAQNSPPCSTYDLKIDSTVLYPIPNENLKPNWWSGNFKISHLQIQIPKIQMVQRYFFDFPSFDTVETLNISMQTNYIYKGTFDGMKSLKKLNILPSPILIVEINTLDILADTLEDLEFVNSNYNNVMLIFGLTGGAPLPKLKTVNIKANIGNSLRYDIFVALTGIIRLDLSYCRIDSIPAEAFDPIAGTIRYLNLANNNLVKLQPNTLIKIIEKGNFIAFHNNMWTCDCNLCEFKLSLLDYPNFEVVPSCETRLEHCDLPITEVDFCPSNDTCRRNYKFTTVSTNSPSTIPTEKDEDSTDVTRLPTTEGSHPKPESDKMSMQKLCQKDKNDSGNVIEIKLQNDFLKLNNRPNGFVDLNFENPTTFFMMHRLRYDEKTIACRFRQKAAQVTLENLQAGNTYTFCPSMNDQTRISPFNCFSHRVSHIFASNSWIIAPYKPLVYSMLGLGACLSILLGSIIGYFILHTYPRLLKGSKNVLVVENSLRNKSNAQNMCTNDLTKTYMKVIRNSFPEWESNPSQNNVYEPPECLSRFDIVKNQLESNKNFYLKENQYGLETIPNERAPVPPPLVNLLTKPPLSLNDAEKIHQSTDGNIYCSVEDIYLKNN